MSPGADHYLEKGEARRNKYREWAVPLSVSCLFCSPASFKSWWHFFSYFMFWDSMMPFWPEHLCLFIWHLHMWIDHATEEWLIKSKSFYIIMLSQLQIQKCSGRSWLFRGMQSQIITKRKKNKAIWTTLLLASSQKVN